MSRYDNTQGWARFTVLHVDLSGGVGVDYNLGGDWTWEAFVDDGHPAGVDAVEESSEEPEVSSSFPAEHKTLRLSVERDLVFLWEVCYEAVDCFL